MPLSLLIRPRLQNLSVQMRLCILVCIVVAIYAFTEQPETHKQAVFIDMVPTAVSCSDVMNSQQVILYTRSNGVLGEFNAHSAIATDIGRCDFDVTHIDSCHEHVVAWSNDGHDILIAHEDGEMCIMAGTRGRKLQRPLIEKLPGPPTDATARGNLAVIAGFIPAKSIGSLPAGYVLVVDTSLGLVVAQFDEESPVTDCHMSSDSSIVTYVTGGNVIVRFGVESGLRESLTIESVTCAEISSDGSRLITGTIDGIVTVWNRFSNKFVMSSSNKYLGSSVNCIALTRDGGNWAVCIERSIYRWDIRRLFSDIPATWSSRYSHVDVYSDVNSEPEWTISVDNKYVSHIAISENADIVAGIADGQIFCANRSRD